MNIVSRCLLVPLCAALPFVAWAAPICEADSGATRAVLVELYTSEGCSSCPPADKALRQLDRVDATAAAATPVVPLALHVDYWDSIGWKDPYAQAGFTKRQAWEVAANRHRTSFTPHFFVDGHEVDDWRDELDARIRAEPKPADARLVVRTDAAGPRAWKISVDVTVDPAVDAAAKTDASGSLQLFIATTESGLASDVRSGENRGVRLEHDHVVRRWIGPIAIRGTSAHVEQIVDAADAPAGRGPMRVVAFVQDARTAAVLQAVRTRSCAAG